MSEEGITKFQLKKLHRVGVEHAGKSRAPQPEENKALGLGDIELQESKQGGAAMGVLSTQSQDLDGNTPDRRARSSWAQLEP